MTDDAIIIWEAIIGAIVLIVFAFIAKNRKRSKEKESEDSSKIENA